MIHFSYLFEEVKQFKKRVTLKNNTQVLITMEVDDSKKEDQLKIKDIQKIKEGDEK